LRRIKDARKLGKVIRDSGSVEGAGEARIATPLLVAVDGKDEAAYGEERFGPIAFLVACKDEQDAVLRASLTIFTFGAITAALYATDETIIAFAEKAFGRAGVNLGESHRQYLRQPVRSLFRFPRNRRQPRRQCRKNPAFVQ
jgi:acyl-CoA reductase-like NAD-dependent aldehyde dehydrogenase